MRLEVGKARELGRLDPGRLLAPVQRPSHLHHRFREDEGGRFSGYYVNFEEPYRRTGIGFDTNDHTLDILVTPASVQDRDGGRRLLWRLRRHLPTIRLVWADAGYAGKLVTWAAQVLTLTLAIVRKRPGTHHFEVLPRRWVVERTFSWLGKCRRLAVDYERKPEHHQAWVQWAMVRVMVKRLARQAPPLPTRALSLAA